MKRSKMVRGIPFENTLPRTIITRSEAMAAFEDLRQQASDVDEMTLEEINAEISKVREEGKVVD